MTTSTTTTTTTMTSTTTTTITTLTRLTQQILPTPRLKDLSLAHQNLLGIPFFANYGFCYLNVTRITKFRYEIKNEMNFGALTIYTNDPGGNLVHEHKTIKI